MPEVSPRTAVPVERGVEFEVPVRHRIGVTVRNGGPAVARLSGKTAIADSTARVMRTFDRAVITCPGAMLT